MGQRGRPKRNAAKETAFERRQQYRLRNVDIKTIRHMKKLLITELHRFVDINNRIPEKRDMLAEFGYHSFTAYIIYFGSWENALAEAFEPYYGVESCYIIEY